MKLIILGTGSAFTLENYQSNMLFEAPEGRLLIDCGSDARRSVAAQGFSALDITPQFTLKEVARLYPYRIDEDRNRFLDSLRKAGLPEG